MCHRSLVRIARISGGVLLILMVLALSGCKGDTGPAGPAGTNPQLPPVITAVYAVPDSIGTNETSTLIVNAYDPNGDSIRYLWTASGGVLSTPTAATTHWTADTLGVYTISVAVSDQSASTNGSVLVGVNHYVPTVIPYYLGDDPFHCSPCHLPKVEQWRTTAHSTVFDTTFIPLAHRTTGYDTTINNGGYDDNPVAALENVQCEACHGPLGPIVGNHFYLSKGAMSGASCGHCHAEYADYQYSGHGTAMARAGGSAAFNAEWNHSPCWNCHIGERFVQIWDSVDWANRIIPDSANQITCGVCHNPHESTGDNPQIRTLAPVTLLYGGEEFPDGFTINTWGRGQLCGQCHHSRRDRTFIFTAIANGNQRADPHDGPQSDMLAGRGSYEIPGFTYLRTNQHALGTDFFDDVCISCHMIDETTPYPHANHNFYPDVDVCRGCHETTLTNFDVDGKQTEIQGLLDQLGLLLPHTQDPDGHNVVSSDTRDTTIWNDSLREAAWAWQFVHLDASRGVHNYAYARSLLNNAIAFLSPPGATELTGKPVRPRSPMMHQVSRTLFGGGK